MIMSDDAMVITANGNNRNGFCLEKGKALK
jgi:hypothetical protein